MAGRPVSAPELGLRVVRWVAVTVAPEGTRAEAIGIGHRLPVRRAVPLRCAAELADAGVPVVVQREEQQAC